jgi:hypothetical protein
VKPSGDTPTNTVLNAVPAGVAQVTTRVPAPASWDTLDAKTKVDVAAAPVPK